MSKTKALLAGVALIYQDTVLPLSPVSTDLSSVGSSISVLRADSSDTVLLDGAPWFLRAEFVREGSDLHLSGPDGQKLIIQEYFYQDPPPDLINPNGVAINGAVVTQLAGPQVPVQYAQSTPADVTEPIGQIETVTGQVKVTHVDRTESILSLGDPVFAGDILETDGDGVVGIIFADQSTFSLGENGRMTLDEMVYDPGTQEGSMAINMLQGAFTFVSGQVAKTDVDAMTIVTPTAVIGVRGSAAGGFIGKQGGLTVSLLPEIGLNGELSITNPVGSETINVPGQSTNVSTLNAPPSGVFTLTPEQMGQAFGSALAGLPNGGNVIPAEIRNGANQGRQLQQAAEEAITEAEAKQADAEAKVAVAEQIQADAQSQVAAAEAAMLQEQAQADAVAAEAQAAEVAALEAVAAGRHSCR